PEWTKSAWLECTDLMQPDFGEKRWMSLTEMLARNPGAVLQNVAWNYRLTPSGLQVLLFGANSGGPTPDYMDVPAFPVVVPVLSTALLALWAFGLIAIYRDRRYWKDVWLPNHATGLVAMVAVAIVA